MSLHEKGKTALSRKDYNLALVLLLEADLEFSKVRSDLLANVDNYGLLNLDIVWCYVKLGSIGQLDDAVGRLAKCKQVFHKAYGENLERVDKIKGEYKFFSQKVTFNSYILLAWSVKCWTTFYSLFFTFTFKSPFQIKIIYSQI